MRFSLTSLIRLLALLALASTTMAVGLSRLSPRPGVVRTPCATGQIGITGFLLSVGDQSKWLDTSNGRLDALPVPSGMRLDYPSRSPWTDNRGGYQVVGRLTPAGSNAAVDGQCGLARISYPDGEILDRIGLNVVPLGPPCWLEGTSARVVFGAADGRLYRIVFESVGSGPGESRTTPIPNPIGWRDEPDRGQGVYLTDPCSAFDPRFGQILVVSYRGVEEKDGVRRFGRAELRWLRLEEEGRTIVDSGRLVVPETDPVAGDLRSPSLSRTSGGDWVLAYLQKSVAKGWDLRHAPLVVEDRRLRPLEASGTLLARGCGPSSPGFSADGRRVWYIDAARPGASIHSVPLASDEGFGPVTR